VSGVKIEADRDDILEKQADGRGRITLGSEYADEFVTVAVIDREDGDPYDYSDMPLADESHELRPILGRTEDGKLILGEPEELESDAEAGKD
jgi:hypothetical protein